MKMLLDRFNVIQSVIYVTGVTCVAYVTCVTTLV